MSGADRLSSTTPLQSLSMPSHTSMPVAKQWYSQPFATIPSRFLNPALHETVQPLLQAGRELTTQLPPGHCASVVHVSPFVLLFVLMHVLLAAGQTVPHVMQFSGSVDVVKPSSSWPSQSSSLPLQTSNVGNTAFLHTGVPPWHSSVPLTHSPTSVEGPHEPMFVRPSSKLPSQSLSFASQTSAVGPVAP